MTSMFDGPSMSSFADELSTVDISDEQDVYLGDQAVIHVGANRITLDNEMIGQTAHNREPTLTGWVARNAWHAKWGDIPGQLTGWHGCFATREQAEQALRDDYLKRRRHEHAVRLWGPDGPDGL